MKKLAQLSLIITIALVCTLTGCASSGGSTENTGNTASTASESAPPDTVTTTTEEDTVSTPEDPGDAATISGSTESTTTPRDCCGYTVNVNGDTSENLANYLHRVPGLMVIGIGAQARVSVRGMGPTTLSIPLTRQNPLFVIDGMRWGRSWSEVYHQINLAEVKNIRVLKGVEAAMYGMDGAFGIIEITHFTARDRREPRN